MEKHEVIIIGGGPAGMAAAVKLDEMAFKDVLLLEKEESAGGVLRQCIHPGFGLIKFGNNYTGPEYCKIYTDLLNKTSVSVEFSATVTEITPVQGGIKVISQSPEGTKERLAASVILASGCRERSRGNLEIPGTRPSGIYTAGAAQALMNLRNIKVGSRIVIVGSGDIGLIMARRFTLEGSDVLAVIEKEKTPGGLDRNLKECIYDFDIPLFTDCQVKEIIGKKRVEAIKIRKSNGADEKISCDTVIIAAGLIPETTMLPSDVSALKCKVEIPGLFLCGNALYVHDLVDDVSASGEEAAIAAAGFVLGHTDFSPLAYENIESTRAERQEFIVERRKNREKNFKNDNRDPLKNGFVICTGCPNSCKISLKDFSGGRCEKGAAFAKAEITDPMRMFTSTLKTESGSLISVRTDKPIPRSLLKKAAEKTRTIILPDKTKSGTVLQKNFLGTNAALVSTSGLD